MKRSVNNYWPKWSSLSRKKRALIYNPGNTLKRKVIVNYIFNYIFNNTVDTNTLRILDVGGGLGDLAFEFFQGGGGGRCT